MNSGQDRTRRFALVDWLEKAGSRDAIVIPGESALTGSDLIRESDRAASFFDEAGVGSCHRIAIPIRERWPMALASLAVLSNAVCVPLNPDYTREEFEYYLKLLKVDWILTCDGESSVADGCAQEMGLGALAISIRDGRANWSVRRKISRTESTGEYAGGGSAPALILHTSGSTAAPKVVPLTPVQLNASVRNLARSLDLSNGDICLNMMPLFHVGGLIDLLLAPLYSGGKVIMAPDISSECFFRLCEQYRPTWFQAVPTVLQDMVSRGAGAGKPGTSGLRLIRAVSSPLTPGLRTRVEDYFGVPVIEIYGMTEACGVITSQTPEAHPKRGSVGKPVGVEVSITDEVGNKLPAGKEGEVLVRGEQVMDGYEGLDSSKEIFLGDWLRTGDRGYFDEEGELFLTGRIKEMINRGGEKISPAEIDRHCEAFPGIREAAAFAMPHSSLGEEVALAVVPESGGKINEPELLKFLSAKLAGFKVPKKVITLDSLPRNRGGKLRRHLLVDSLGGGDTSGAAAPVLSATEQRLVKIWAECLEVDAVGPEDNFFEMGGDSLKAATLGAALQKAFRVEVDAAALFDYQTPRAFADYLTEKLSSPESGETKALTIPKELFEELKAFNMGWKGERRTANSLVVGRHTMGSLPPLFWCAQGAGEVEVIARHLNPDRPIYGMRSLYKVTVRSEEYNRLISGYYADEISEIQPEGAIHLGGFCEGGKIACEVARQLQERGREIEVLILQEYYEPTPYEMDVVFLAAEHTGRGPRFFFNRPELGFPRLCRKRYAFIESPWSHDDYYVEPFSNEAVETIESILQRKIPFNHSGGEMRSKVSESLQGLELSARCPRILHPGASFELIVVLKNSGEQEIQPTGSSGLTVGQRWLDREGKQQGMVGASAEINAPLGPGESTEMKLNVSTPSRQCRRTLEISCVEEGIEWLVAPLCTNLRFKVDIFPAARNLNRIFKYKTTGT